MEWTRTELHSVWSGGAATVRQDPYGSFWEARLAGRHVGTYASRTLAELAIELRLDPTKGDPA